MGRVRSKRRRLKNWLRVAENRAVVIILLVIVVVVILTVILIGFARQATSPDVVPMAPTSSIRVRKISELA